MTLPFFVQCAALPLLLVCSAFFSSAETALFSLNPIQIHRMRRTHPLAADLLQRLLNSPTRLLSTILIGNTLVNVTASVLGFAVADHLMHAGGELVAIPLMTMLLLVFGEVAPKRLAMAHAVRMARVYSRVLAFLIPTFAPLRILLERSAVLIRHRPPTSSQSLTEDEFLTVVEVGEEEGVLDEEERTMVDGIIRLEETQASDVMTPRVDLIGIDLEDSPEEQEQIARSVRFRYLPIYRDSLDQPEGFLDVPSFLLAETPNLQDAMIPPFFIPENAPLDSLLATFQRERKRVAFVADEFGGTAGLVTRGDILEEIAADVDNEYGDQEFTMQKVGDVRWLINGSTSLEDINYEVEINLEAEGADRIAGWITAQAERIPRTGDAVTGQGVRVTVQRVRRNRITLVLLEKLPPQPESAEDEE
jgi:putative hemolysin